MHPTLYRSSRTIIFNLQELMLYVAICATILLGACSKPVVNSRAAVTKPPVVKHGLNSVKNDQRARFREILCEVLAARVASPDYRSCNQVLTTYSGEQAPTGKPVSLPAGQRPFTLALVQGLGWDCTRGFVDPGNELLDDLQIHGFNRIVIEVDGLSSSRHNAKQIRDAVMGFPAKHSKQIVLMGYSKGAPDILEAVVNYPELTTQVAAVVSIAGAVGGSPLAADAPEYLLKPLTLLPGMDCQSSDSGAIDSLRPHYRSHWLAQHTLPDSIQYYSLLAAPSRENISRILRPSYNQLSRVDARNDGQVTLYDQFIPGSTLLGYLNADHWAVAVPISRNHELISQSIVDKNAFPREAVFEAVMRFVEEDLRQCCSKKDRTAS